MLFGQHWLLNIVDPYLEIPMKHSFLRFWVRLSILALLLTIIAGSYPTTPESASISQPADTPTPAPTQTTSSLGWLTAADKIS